MGFWKDKKVLITGHTGFKGSWLSAALLQHGAHVTGYALPAEQTSLFNQLSLSTFINHYEADIRDKDCLSTLLLTVRPDIIFHLAAQPLVFESYDKPHHTFEVNVMGTASLLQAAADTKFEGTFIAITSDKVYQNTESGQRYREVDPLGGIDPYSASKAASEFVIRSYGDAIFGPQGAIKLASARAGNVVGGGDWSDNRIIPDAVRSIMGNNQLEVRNPYSIRPWMHVLDIINGYLQLAKHISEVGSAGFNGAYNFGPDKGSYSVDMVLTELSRHLDFYWTKSEPILKLKESTSLCLNSKKARSQLGWRPAFNFFEMIAETAQWYQSFLDNKDMNELSRQQLATFFGSSR